METEEFRRRGKEMIDYICDYMSSLQDRPVIPDVQPGYLRQCLPPAAPEQPELWDDVMKDVEQHIMRGITHWQHPRFHAYFPAGNAYPSIMGGMLADALGIVGFSWAASPACAELEMVVLDWLAQMTHMPQHFQHQSGLGGGVMQGSASDSILVTMLAARRDKLRQIKAEHEDEQQHFEEGKYLSHLVAYCSKLAHSCVEKAGMISCIQVHQLDYDSDDLALRGDTLKQAIDEDRRKGLIPFFVCAVLGTTACASCDDLEGITDVCQAEGLWCHVDAAYAGSAFICEELTYFLRGVEKADSYNFNPNKWLLINFDCSVLWVRDKEKLTSSMIVDPVYLQHKHSSNVVDFRHWGIPLSRRFRSLKIWFVIRSYGVDGLRRYIRNHCKLAKLFESQVKRDSRFELVGQVHFGLVCFRWKECQDSNALTQYLIRQINDSGKLHMVPATVKGQYIIRFAICSEHAKEEDIFYAWNVIKTHADEISTTIKTLNMWTRQAFRSTIAKEVDLGEEEKDGSTAAAAAEGSSVAGLLNGRIKSTTRHSNSQDSLKSLNEAQASQGAADSAPKEEESEREREDEVGKHEQPEDAKIRSAESLTASVKVDDSDLGVGVTQEQKRLRRNSLLRMISDPFSYPGGRPIRMRNRITVSTGSPTGNSDLSAFDENSERDTEEEQGEKVKEENGEGQVEEEEAAVEG